MRVNEGSEWEPSVVLLPEVPLFEYESSVEEKVRVSIEAHFASIHTFFGYKITSVVENGEMRI